MSLIRYRPFSAISDLQNEINSLFSKQFSSENGESYESVLSNWAPAVDIKEEDKQFVIHADVPGVDPRNIEIHMENDVLTIKGEKLTESKKEEEGYSRIERSSGSFYRRFTLPDTIDAANIQAKTKNGVLEIIIPKTKKAESKRIQVKAED